MRVQLRKAIVLAGVVTCLATCGSAQISNVKISAVFPGGGSATANTYIRDYVELLNTGTTTVSLNGNSLQYGSAAGNYGAPGSNTIAFTAAHEIGPKSYFLVSCGSSGAASPALTAPSADMNSTALSLAAGSGKVALVAQSAALNTKPALPDVLIVDAVSWGTADNAEGGTSANNGVAINSTLAIYRKNLGQQDTNNNNNDFDVATTTASNPPRNSQSLSVPVVLSAFEAE